MLQSRSGPGFILGGITLTWPQDNTGSCLTCPHWLIRILYALRAPPTSALYLLNFCIVASPNSGLSYSTFTFPVATYWIPTASCHSLSCVFSGEVKAESSGHITHRSSALGFKEEFPGSGPHQLTEDSSDNTKYFWGKQPEKDCYLVY